MAYPPPMHGGPMPMLMVPYIGMIPGGLMPGKKISIHGMVVTTCSRFAVNLQCGPHVNPRDDISLHMSFRYDVPAPYVVRNSLQMLQWGLEEAHGYLSFGRGHTFEITIHVEHDHYKIYFNGHHFTDFRYRVPLMRVNHLAIDGEVVLHSIKMDGYEIHAHQQQPYQQQQPYPQQQQFYPRPTGPSGFGQPQHHPHPQHSGSAGYGGRMIPPAPVPMAHVYPVYPHVGPVPSAAIPIAAGMGVAMGASMVAHDVRYMDKNAKKAMKKQKKEMKKAMKHHKHAKHSHGYHHGGHHHGKSSSSSSSSSEEE